MSGGSVKGPVLTAHAAGMTGCETCGLAAPAGSEECRRCGSSLPREGRRSLTPVWFWLTAGLFFYIPANLEPMLITSQFGSGGGSTILGGVVELIEYHAYGVAAVVFLASIVIPVSKFLIIFRLGLMAGGGPLMDREKATKLYEFVEFIGRWSMIDLFVVAVLSALVQLGFLAAVHPGPAAPWFLLSVACTMLSARAIDPRLIWDRTGAK